MAGDYGQIVVSWAATTVIEAPPLALVSLALVSKLDERALFVSGDKLYLGNDKDGNEVIYKVTGWHAGQKALIVARVYE